MHKNHRTYLMVRKKWFCFDQPTGQKLMIVSTLTYKKVNKFKFPAKLKLSVKLKHKKIVNKLILKVSEILALFNLDKTFLHLKWRENSNKSFVPERYLMPVMHIICLHYSSLLLLNYLVN